MNSRYAFWNDGSFCPLDDVTDDMPQDFQAKTFASDEDALHYIAKVANHHYLDEVLDLSA